ncbi:Hypothetical protein NTJ_06364 [Nesidiocoris tenuis]|uniref:Uncharacterized protein n=1 Tax=Nesidiocoris tenuis TaxID=355587 RepID=A0ABN7ARK8_9HEMI|nr:Hypothetical protein NTJ_06364 [Nesidiocoris tenuis]
MTSEGPEDEDPMPNRGREHPHKVTAYLMQTDDSERPAISEIVAQLLGESLAESLAKSSSSASPYLTETLNGPVPTEEKRPKVLYLAATISIG